MTQHSCKLPLQKMGAWTVAIVPLNIKKIFGVTSSLRIKGTIDGYPFSGTSLMPMKEGTYLLAVRAEIRKAIRKQAGEKITLVFERDTAALEVPKELKEAFKASPEAKKMFATLSYSAKANYTKPITDSKNKETRERNAVNAVIKLERDYLEKQNSKRMEPTGKTIIPEDLKTLLAEHALLEDFEKLPASHKKEYLQWIAEAKKEETRLKRMEGTITKLAAKKGA